MYGGNIEASYHEEIYRMMTFDGLTQIYNKRYFTETLEREISRSRRYNRELGLVLFDIDHFKQKNDTFGHLAGDSISKTCPASCAPSSAAKTSSRASVARNSPF